MPPIGVSAATYRSPPVGLGLGLRGALREESKHPRISREQADQKRSELTISQIRPEPEAHPVLSGEIGDDEIPLVADRQDGELAPFDFFDDLFGEVVCGVEAIRVRLSDPVLGELVERVVGS
jgi:hypothetical protein